MPDESQDAQSIVLSIADTILPKDASDELRETMDDLFGGDVGAVDAATGVGLALGAQAEGMTLSEGFRQLAQQRQPEREGGPAIHLRESVNDEGELVSVRLLADVPPESVQVYHNGPDLLIQAAGVEIERTIPFTPDELLYQSQAGSPHTEILLTPQESTMIEVESEADGQPESKSQDNEEEGETSDMETDDDDDDPPPLPA